MGIILGTLGRMIKLPYVGSQQAQSEERYAFDLTLENKRKAQVKPRGPRTWALSADHFRPNEHSLLSQFADGAWGNGPFWFLSADALVTNILPPDVVSGDASAIAYDSVVRPGGPLLTPDGWAARSVLNTVPGSTLHVGGNLRVPMIPGIRVTGAAYVSGVNSAIRLYFYDFAGNQLSSAGSPVTGGAGVVVRSWVTVTAPANAVSAMVAAQNTVQACWPSITWSDGLLPFGDGQGCAKAVVHGFRVIRFWRFLVQRIRMLVSQFRRWASAGGQSCWR